MPFDGKITGFAPAEGEDCALWHLQMDDGDEEELEEDEVRVAIEAFVSGRAAPAAGAPAAGAFTNFVPSTVGYPGVKFPRSRGSPGGWGYGLILCWGPALVGTDPPPSPTLNV